MNKKTRGQDVMDQKPTYEQQQAELVKKQNEMLQKLPEEFRSAVAYHCYEQGHAYGQNEINIYVGDLVSALKEPIRKYTERVAADATTLFKKKVERIMTDATAIFNKTSEKH